MSATQRLRPNDRDGGSGGASTPVASSDYLYDPRGNLIAESQFHANANIPTYDPTIWYTWNYEPASQGNRERLESIQYPIPVPDGATSTLNRLLTLSYGAAGSAADALSQVTAVTDSDLGLLASFQYTGTGRRVAFDRGGTTLSPVVRSSVFDNPIAAWDQGSIALTDSGGDVVRQHTFDPYGEILTAEDFDTHPGIKVGHQGLFFDRLEPSAPVGGLISMSAAVQLQPGIFGLYQARNRVLLPRYGRWAQKDPNASGMLHASLWHGGQALRPGLVAGSLQGVLGDGLHLHALFGNNPFNVTDPMGLFGFVSGLMTGLNMFDTMTEALDQAEIGVREGVTILSAIEEYNESLLDAIEWALDPNAAWDEFSYGSPVSSGGHTGVSNEPAMAGSWYDNFKPFANKGKQTRFHNRRKNMPETDWIHNNAVFKRARKLQKQYGVENVKFNQDLKTPDGTTVRDLDTGRKFRPDIQVFIPPDKIMVIEVYHKQSRSAAKNKIESMQEALGQYYDRNGSGYFSATD